MEASSGKSVVIIGSGCAGLTSLRYCSQVTSQIVVFEAKDQIGGMWIYQPYSELTHPHLQKDTFYKNTGFLHSSMYEPLTSNVPFMSMTFADFPYPQAKAVYRKSGNTHTYKKTTEGPSLLGDHVSDIINRAQFLEYINEYALHFGLHKYIKLRHFVKRVRYLPALDQAEINDWKVKAGTPKRFLLEVVKIDSEGGQETIYCTSDYLINANGHYSMKNIPNLPGLKDYTGEQIHMHDLRNIGDVKAKKILVLGGSFGAIDLVWQLLFDFSHNFQTLYFCGKVDKYKDSEQIKEFLSSQKLILKPFLKEFKGAKQVVFQDNSELQDADLIIWATGYQFSYSYFQQSNDKLFHGMFDIYTRRPSAVNTYGCKAFGPLYLHCLSAKDPHLMFPGLLQKSLTNGIINNLCGILFASIIGGYLSFDPDFLLVEAKKELELFREQDPTLMSYGTYSKSYTPMKHIKEIEQVLGFDEAHSKEILERFDQLEHILTNMLGGGKFKEYKSYNFFQKIYKGEFFEIETSPEIFSKRIRHTTKGVVIIEEKNGNL